MKKKVFTKILDFVNLSISSYFSYKSSIGIFLLMNGTIPNDIFNISIFSSTFKLSIYRIKIS